MKFSKSYYCSSIVGAMIVLLGLTFVTFPRQAQAKTPKEFLVGLEFPPGPNRQPPQSTVGAGVRGKTCVAAQLNKPLTALMSNRNNQTETVSGNPTFFVYVPTNNAEIGEFILRDNQGKEIASQEISVDKKSGIFKIRLPKSVSLEVGGKYQWEFSLDCESLPKDRNVSISGEIQRVELSAEAKEELAKAIEPLQQARVYANNNIWQETLSIMAGERCNSPEEWVELLNSVGLGAFVMEPFVRNK
jgi:hypothetical protein